MSNKTFPYSLYQDGKDLNLKYLTTLDNTVQDMLDIHSRVFALRVDLQLPDTEFVNGYRLMSRFMDSLKAQLSASEIKRSKQGVRIYRNTLRYVWAKEYGTKNELEHYHLLLLFNKDAYYRLGDYRTEGSIANRIHRVWVSVLGGAVDYDQGLVHFPKNGSYYIDANSNDYEDQLDELMHRASYLCKNQTKVLSSKSRSFGSSPHVVVKKGF